jgi:hypothetical protein
MESYYHTLLEAKQWEDQAPKDVVLEQQVLLLYQELLQVIKENVLVLPEHFLPIKSYQLTKH